MTMTVVQWAVAFWLAALLSGVSAVAVYEALYRQLSPHAPLQARVLYRLGQGLVLLATVLLAGGAFGLGVAGVLAAVR